MEFSHTTANLALLDTVLYPLGENVIHATSGEQALRYAQEQDFAVILVDADVQNATGFDIAFALNLNERS